MGNEWSFDWGQIAQQFMAKTLLDFRSGNFPYICGGSFTPGAWGWGFPGQVGDSYSSSWGGGSSSSSKLSYEERKAKNLEQQKLNREFNALKGLLDALAKDESILSSAEREDLKYDVTHLQGKNKEEKYESLKALYNKYKDTIKNNLGKLGEISKDFAGIGYESETVIDNHINELSSAITNNATQTLEGFETMENIEVLDLLSSWNSNSSVSSKHLMQTVIDKYKALSSSSSDSAADSKKLALENFAKTLKSKLSTKAGELANNAMLKDDTLKEQLKALRSELDAASLEHCADKFENLYEACRIAGAKIIENTYNEKYEFLGSDNLFANILSNTIEDLKAEGFDAVVSNEAKAQVNLSGKTTNEQVNALVEEGTLVKVTISSTQYYEEAVPTGGRAYRRVFVIEDAKLKVIEEAKIEDNQLNNNTTKTEVDAASIRQDVNNAKPTYSGDLDSVVTFLGMKKDSSPTELGDKKYDVYSVKIGDETKKYAKTERGFCLINNNNNTFDLNSPLSKADLIKDVYKETKGAKDKGKQTAKDLVGCTTTDEQQQVANTINNDINAINVWEFLKGYQSNHGGGERFFDQLNNEDWDLSDKDSKNDLMKKVLNYCIDNLKARMEADPANSQKYQGDINSLTSYLNGIDNGTTNFEALDTFTYKYVKDHREFPS